MEAFRFSQGEGHSALRVMFITAGHALSRFLLYTNPLGRCSRYLTMFCRQLVISYVYASQNGISEEETGIGWRASQLGRTPGAAWHLFLLPATHLQAIQLSFLLSWSSFTEEGSTCWNAPSRTGMRSCLIVNQYAKKSLSACKGYR